MKRIFITGGHYTPARAVIDKLREKGEWEIFYIGRKYAMEDDKALALEYLELSQETDIKYLCIDTGRLQRKFFVNIGQSIKSFLKIFIGFGQSLFWLAKFRPHLILSFGGYIAVPIVIPGRFLGIPVVTHEQTVVSGLANRIITKFSRKVLVSWPESVLKFPRNKVVLTGNPVRKEILNKISKSPTSPRLRGVNNKSSKKTKLVYITGGNQGAHVINNAVGEVLEQLLLKYQIIHQTGDSSVHRDYEKLTEAKNKLQDKIRDNYRVVKFLNSLDVADALFTADLVISRSGGNTISELAALGKPAILIPIPWSGGDEQTKNAGILADQGSAEILLQKELNGGNLVKTISKMMENLEKYEKAGEKGKSLVKLDAASRIVGELQI